MRVVHLSRFDSGDGASNCAVRVHQGLLRRGHDSSMFVAEVRGDSLPPRVTLFEAPMDLGSRLVRRWRYRQITSDFARYENTRPAGLEAFSDDRSPHGDALLRQLPKCDLLHIQQMFKFVDYRSFFANYPRHTPVVRTLHDVSFFAGGCHTPESCDKYAQQCGACPQLGSKDPQDLSRQIWLRKNVAFSAIPPGRLHTVAPSRWLANEARRSSLLQNIPVTLIPHGVDVEVFRPRDRGFARDLFNIPQNATLVLFVAEPITRPLKNFALLVQALQELHEVPNLMLASAGGGKPPVEVGIPYLNLGTLRNDRLLSLVYSAADVFILPSRQENFPLTILEAMACGVPVVGSAVGGIPDMVRPGVTGALFPVQDVIAMRAAIRDVLQNPARRAEMGANCRRVAVEEYSLELQIQRHVELYENMLAGH